MAQNEMKAKPALPERVRSMEGLGVTGGRPQKRVILAFCDGFFSSASSVSQGEVLEQMSFRLLACSSEKLLRFAARQLVGRAARFDCRSGTLPCGTALQVKTTAKGCFFSTSFRAAASFPETIQTDFVAALLGARRLLCRDRKSTRLNSSHVSQSRMPSSA